jgi:hypothetical protein
LKYSFDTSEFIEAWNRYYPPDIFRTYWENLSTLIENNDVVSVEEVKQELKRQDDPLSRWCGRFGNLFLPLTTQVQQEASSILGRYPALINPRGIRSGADPWVIAVAKVHTLTVVTFERGSTNPSPGKPKIPDVCNREGINCIFIPEFIRAQGWSF